ncbi:class I SAM-dependent methyltransferase [Halomonas sp. LBP4]|uniref:class I SAM-dependent methyltransferase n=1 Tax=Halomonas sp. LBP4 TaxID=2044917 RepID=UPI000D75E61B|nr:class I SAM-dependent methyltransferase [Halomonas sp. LBP4]PXX99623.1 methyltransferase [Halomonas sp. LBP4]
MPAEKITLSGKQETFLITLYAKAMESRMPDSLLKDEFAANTIRRIDYDFAKLNVPHDPMIGLALRAKIFDDWTREFIDHTPVATVLHLGCGLDSRVFRLEPPTSVRWFDVDFPKVIELRRRLYPERDGCHLIGASVTDPDWLRDVPADQPAMVIAEGLLPYLRKHEVLRLLDTLTESFPSGELAFDGYSRLGVSLLRLAPPVRATGASLHWGIDDPRELERQVPKLKLVKELTGLDPTQIARMSWPTRLTICLYQSVPAFRRLGRFLLYRF